LKIKAKVVNEDTLELEIDPRDLFAAAALANVSTDTNPEHIARWVYEIADAMLEERKRK
jgi:hypothetical protein